MGAPAGRAAGGKERGEQGTVDADRVARLREALADSPVVLLHGPRQCGKTTLAQIMAAELGGKVEASEHREFGYAEIMPGESGLFGGFSDADSGKPMLKVWMSHGDKVVVMPDGFD